MLTNNKNGKKPTKRKTTKKNLGGRPKIVWDDKQYAIFEGLCGIQATIEELESVLNIDHKTLDRLCKEHYKDTDGKEMSFSQTYKKYSATGKMSLRRSQFRAADAGNVPMLIWLGKQYLGQKEQQETTITDSNISFTIKPASERSPEEE